MKTKVLFKINLTLVLLLLLSLLLLLLLLSSFLSKTIHTNSHYVNFLSLFKGSQANSGSKGMFSLPDILQITVSSVECIFVLPVIIYFQVEVRIFLYNDNLVIIIIIHLLVNRIFYINTFSTAQNVYNFSASRDFQILRRVRQRVQDFLSTKQCSHVNQRDFGGNTWQPWSIHYEFQRECRIGGNKLSNVRIFIILRSAEGVTSSNNGNSASFSSKKMAK